MELSKGQTIGVYRLVEPAGTGGMAEVWRAYHPRLDAYVAIKFLSPRLATDESYLRRFLREARAVSALEHPNILTVHDFGEQGDWTYMVSPFLSGGTLEARLRRGAWTIDESVAVLAPLAAALDYAHARGLVHRDVKPSNVLFSEQGRLILSDFGIAQMLETTAVMSQAGLIIGTPMYMSPEQADAQPTGPPSDLYSLGIIAYEMLAGEPPFKAETPLALLRAHIDKPLPPPRTLNADLPEAVEAPLFKILAKDPGDRFATGADFVAALRAAGGAPVSLPNTALLPPADPSQIQIGTVRPDAGVGVASDATRPPSPSRVGPTVIPPPPAAPGPPRLLTPPPMPPGGAPPTAGRVTRRAVLVGLGAGVVAVAGLGVFALSPRDSGTVATISATAPPQVTASATDVPAPTSAPAVVAVAPTTAPAPTAIPPTAILPTAIPPTATAAAAPTATVPSIASLGLNRPGVISLFTTATKGLSVFSRLNDAGQPEGFFIDLYDDIGRRLGLKIDSTVMSTGDVGNYAQYDIFDLFGGYRSLADTTDSQPVYWGYNGLVVHRSSAYKSLDDMAGKRVVFDQFTDPAMPAIREHYPQVDWESSLREATIARLHAGVAEGVLTGGTFAENEVRQDPSLAIVQRFPYDKPTVALQVAKGKTALKAAIDAQLDAMFMDGTYKKLYSKWFDQPIVQPFIDLHPGLASR